MRAAMCFSHFQLPRCQIHTFSGSWWKKVHKFGEIREYNYKYQLIGPNISSLQGGHSRRWTQKSLSTNIEAKNILSRKTTNIVQQIADVTSLTPSNLNTSRIDIDEWKHSYIEQEISEKDVSKLTTIFTFDIETTGFNRVNERIIEIALRDLSGGKESTFQTLINPEKMVTNTFIHGISRQMVTSSGVPRMKELIPILLDYVKSRQKPGGQVLFIAHNAKGFDVPFLINEFKRCSFDIPPDWVFVDSISLAREIIKDVGSKRAKRSLQALREYYGIPLVGNAHRAMSDVNVLSMVIQKMTHDLKLSVSSLLQHYAFTASEIINDNSKKKKN